jgi:hypothetical protein
MKTPRVYANIAIFYGWEPDDDEIDALVDIFNEVESGIIGWSPAPDEGDETSPAIHFHTLAPVPDGAELYVDQKDWAKGRDWAFIAEIDLDSLSEDERAEWEES